MFSYLLYKLGIFLANILPVDICSYIATRAADIYSFFSREDFYNVKENLKVILGVSEKNLDLYAKGVFRNFALYLVEFFRLKKFNKKLIKEKIEITGIENFANELKKGFGLIGLTGHIGNWELLGAVMSEIGFKVNAVALEHKNTLINKIFVSQREAMGLKVLKLGDVRGCIEALKKNEVLALVGDRDFSNNPITIKFFGRDMQFPKGPATLSLRANANILPGFLIREKNRFKVLLYGPINIKRSGIMEEDVVRLTQGYAAILEELVRKYPDQWLVFRKFYKE